MIPTCEDLASAPLTHRLGDLWNAPGLTNQIGTVQTDTDVTGLVNLNFPPLSASLVTTASLFVDGRYFPTVGIPVETTWAPDRIIRRAACAGLRLESVTAMAVGRNAVVQELAVTSTRGEISSVDIAYGVKSAAVCRREPWNQPFTPVGATEPHPEPSIGAVVHRGASAVHVQGLRPMPAAVNGDRLTVRLKLAPGETKRLCFAGVLSGTEEEALAEFQTVVADVPGRIEEARRFWDEELRSVFTPGNARYSGWLPELDTVDEEISRVYHQGVLGVVYLKRDNPASVYGRAYDTLMPRFWQTVTFLWDYSLSSLVHALLDPDVMRKYLELWMCTDVHAHFGTEYLTGGPVGPWYSVNDYAMTGMIGDYVRWNGALEWLDRVPAGGSGKRVREYLLAYARHWQSYRTASGRADYGGINNLLECVSSYIHEVASLNAANVYNLRAAADLVEGAGDRREAERLRGEALALLPRVLELYRSGKGFWGAGQPDGTIREVRHIYDFITIGRTILSDLDAGTKGEMTRFCAEELQTETWARALSCYDADAWFSIRPDHQWNGAYPAWPPGAVSTLYGLGETDRAFRWLKGLAKSARQGPFGQAHFTEEFMEGDGGGARKGSNEFPYICDWTVSSGGSWVSLIIESIFGVRVDAAGRLTAEPRFGPFDPAAELRNLRCGDRVHHVGRKGLLS